MNYKIDLHTHSNYSFDGGITLQQYRHILESGLLDFIAITDHNRIDAALQFHKQIGNKIIVGEEIKSSGGDIIGLYLKKNIAKGLSIKQTIKEIKRQKGLVYVPHPFDQRRSGISESDLLSIINQVDILETFNARFVQKDGNARAVEFNHSHDLPAAAGSDAHALSEIGTTFTTIGTKPTQSNLAKSLKDSTHTTQKVSVINFFNPLINKIKHGTKPPKLDV